MSSSVLSPTEWRSFLCLNYLTLGTVLCRAGGGRWDRGTQPRHSDSGWWGKQGEDAAEKRLPAITVEMTERSVEGGTDIPKEKEKKVWEYGLETTPLRCMQQNWNIHKLVWISYTSTFLVSWCVWFWFHGILATFFHTANTLKSPKEQQETMFLFNSGNSSK